jgi:hypothetical protein
MHKPETRAKVNILSLRSRFRLVCFDPKVIRHSTFSFSMKLANSLRCDFSWATFSDR